ncbi:transporter substrate-binding domain-containing protein [Ruegeria sp. 2012CJ41-6]|uniref:Transporter substrate-binding domain-containing protein n=1 Tax=Ruegeria spongiae TaxID=2942209 RepID=A0ABT0Q8H5_9RHOB|nr:transporter substrate-binding domain-containing protein [Ruegeria spongiae]MCL6286180.1 transporter substrate-binding domain-containing protein [Ruegeria spongiae]
MTTKRQLIGVAAALAAAAALPKQARAQGTGDVQQELSSESVIEGIKRRGVIRIGLGMFVPWSMRDTNGDLIGFELDVGRKLANEMGVEVEFVPTAWDGIIPALIAGSFDVIISGMTITAQRNLTINFSDPYAWSGATILANRAMTEGFTIESYNQPDVTFSARRGSNTATYITQLFPDARLLQFDEDGASTQEVLNGNAHATLASEPTPSREARNYPDTLHVPFNETFNAVGDSFGYRKGDPDAANFFNNWIRSQWRLGWLKERNDYWFRGTDWEDQVDL